MDTTISFKMAQNIETALFNSNAVRNVYGYGLDSTTSYIFADNTSVQIYKDKQSNKIVISISNQTEVYARLMAQGI